MALRIVACAASLLLVVGCIRGPDTPEPDGGTPAVTPAVDAGVDAGAPLRGPEVGTGDHSPSSIVLTEIAGPSAGLKQPRDLAFNPLRPDELWVVNHDDDSAVIVSDTLAESLTFERRKDAYAVHFMAEPSAIAFGAAETTIGKPGTFATCGESRNTYDHSQPHNDFMGPTLWSSDLSVFAMLNPNGLGSHLDMLHNSPLCMGIAHESANAYWTFGGLSESIVRYDFAVDDGIGNDDHSDGTAFEYVTGQVKYAPEIPSHLAYDAKTGLLYIADTGNYRIVKLDTKTGTRGAALAKMEPMAEYRRMNDAVLTEVVPEASGHLLLPSGLELHNDLLYVSDYSNGRISVFTLEGERVNWVDTGLPAGALAGMAFGTDGKLYLVDRVGDRVLRIDPKP